MLSDWVCLSDFEVLRRRGGCVSCMSATHLSTPLSILTLCRALACLWCCCAVECACRPELPPHTTHLKSWLKCFDASPCVFSLVLLALTICLSVSVSLSLYGSPLMCIRVFVLRPSEDRHSPSHHQGPRHPAAGRGHIRARLGEREGQSVSFFCLFLFLKRDFVSGLSPLFSPPSFLPSVDEVTY